MEGWKAEGGKGGRREEKEEGVSGREMTILPSLGY
jgi:hypothetical protein